MSEKSSFLFKDNFNKEPNREENTSLESSLREIYSLINEMDSNGYFLETAPIKKFLLAATDKNGNINPTRIHYLQKLVSRIYFENYLNWLKKRELDNLKENSTSERVLYEIPFAGQHGEGRINFIEFLRKDPLTWMTSPVGKGYTTSCNDYPEWLKELINEKEGWRVEHIDYGFGLWLEIKKIKSKILGLDVEITEYEREHENGHDACLSLHFTNKKDADKFSEFLSHKEKEKLPKEEMLFYLRKKESLFNWAQFYLIDPQYRILAPETYNEQFLKKYEKYGLSRKALVYGVNKYLKDWLIPNLLKRTYKAEEIAKNYLGWQAKDQKSFLEKIRELRYQMINWQMLEELLKDCEEKIIEFAKQADKENLI